MFDFSTLKSIRNEAITSMVRDSDDEKVTSLRKKTVFILVFYLLPLAVAIVSICKNVKLSTMESYVGSSIAIFTGLFFSLLISIGAKVRAENLNPNKDKDNFKKFKTSMKQIANITLYIIIYGIVIFFIMLLNSLLKTKEIELIESIFTFIALFLLVQYTISLFFLLQRLYYVVHDEIGNTI